MATKTISMDTYKWGHFGSIIFHLLLACFIIYFGIRLRKTSLSSKKSVLIFNKIVSVNTVGLILFWIGIVFGIVSLLSLWPIFTTKYDKYIIG